MEESQLKQKVIERLQTIFDPEIPVNIYELGLIYEVNVLPINNVQIVMTLTAPSCPAAQSLPVEVDQKVREIEGRNAIEIAKELTTAYDNFCGKANSPHEMENVKNYIEDRYQVKLGDLNL